MTKINQLESLKVLKAVTEAGSFTAAAQRLQISTARVSKSIERLEIELGTTLFNRNTRYMQATQSGEHCYNKALTLLNQWEQLREELKESHITPKGRLRISIPMTWALYRFAPLLIEFNKQYPEITLDVQLNDQHVNILEDEFDLVLRLTSQLPDSQLLCRKIASYQFTACATPGYLKKWGTPTHPNDLKTHRCLVYTRPGAARKWIFMADQKRIEVHMDPYLQSNNSALIKSTLVADQGIALIPDFLVAKEISEGLLEPILQNFETTELNLYLLRPRNPTTSHRLRLLHDFISENINHTCAE